MKYHGAGKAVGHPPGILRIPQQEDQVPKVGNKHFPYTKAGQKAAEAEAKKSGKPMKKGAKK